MTLKGNVLFLLKFNMEKINYQTFLNQLSIQYFMIENLSSKTFKIFFI